MKPKYDLHNYETGEYIRAATIEELRESLDAATRDGGAGVITVDNVRCYAIGELDEEVTA